MVRGRIRNKLHRGKIFLRQNYQTKAKTQNIRKAFESAKKSHNYVNGLKSMFDFNGMVALAGLWVVWNSFLVGIGKIKVLITYWLLGRLYRMLSKLCFEMKMTKVYSKILLMKSSRNNFIFLLLFTSLCVS